VSHAPASVLALAEPILDGAYKTLGISAFGDARDAANKPYRERGIV